MSRLRHLIILIILATLWVGCGPKGAKHYNDGVAKFQQKKYRDAIAAFEKTIAANPARNFGLYPNKGTIAVGSDADLTVIDMNKEQVITPEICHSAQDHSPFEGKKLKGWPVTTIRRGEIMFQDGKTVGSKGGRFLKRPDAMFK